MSSAPMVARHRASAAAEKRGPGARVLTCGGGFRKECVGLNLTIRFGCWHAVDDMWQRMQGYSVF